MGREGWLALGLAAVVVAGFAWWLGPGEPTAEVGPESTIEPRPWRPEGWVPPEDGPSAPPSEVSTARAHAKLGEALGYVPIYCFVGESYDGMPLTGAWRPTVEDGWFSDVVDTMQGERVVEARLVVEPGAAEPSDRVANEHLFYVQWEAAAPGVPTQCTVLPISRAELVVTVLDQDGAPVEGVRVAGCGASEATDASGVAELIGVKADRQCRLLVYCESEDERVCLPALPEEPLVFAANEVRHLTVDMEVVDMGEDYERAADLLLKRTLARMPAPSDLTQERLFLPASEEIALLEALVDQATSDADEDLFTAVLAKKRRIRRLTALSAEAAELEAALLAEPDDPALVEALEEIGAEREALVAEGH